MERLRKIQECLCRKYFHFTDSPATEQSRSARSQECSASTLARCYPLAEVWCLKKRPSITFFPIATPSGSRRSPRSTWLGYLNKVIFALWQGTARRWTICGGYWKHGSRSTVKQTWNSTLRAVQWKKVSQG